MKSHIKLEQNKKLFPSRSYIRNLMNHEFMIYPNISLSWFKYFKVSILKFLSKCKRNEVESLPPLEV